MKMKIFVTAYLLVSIMFTAMPILALSDEFKSYEQLSPNGKYVFVMLAKSPDPSKVDTLKKAYRHSGLYTASKSRKCLWRVNWYASRVHVSSDGIHLVRIGRTKVASINGKPNTIQLALAFYANGNLSKKYLIEDLISDPRSLFKAKGGFDWQNRVAFDGSAGKLEVALVTGQTKLFDIKSGDIIATKTAKHKRPRS
jgi:hypothetical protein